MRGPGGCGPSQWCDTHDLSNFPNLPAEITALVNTAAAIGGSLSFDCCNDRDLCNNDNNNGNGNDNDNGNDNVKGKYLKR